MGDLSKRIVDNMHAIHGKHAGFRAVHAKGSCCRGTFTAVPEAARICTAPHFQGDDIPVTVRFSNGSGRPTRADGARDERGMAVKFHLPDGSNTDIVSMTLPVFFVKTPEDFVAFLETQVPDPETGKPDLQRITEFIEQHPETQTAVGFAMFAMAPASYANCTFHGIHAFRVSAPDGVKKFVRYRWAPDAGAATLTDEETRQLGVDYLQEELAHRLKESSFGFDLYLQIAAESDDPNDPTTAWPDERETVKVGHLTISEFAGRECEPMVFDPVNVTSGIELSDDQILHARSPAYSVSYDLRAQSTTS